MKSSKYLPIYIEQANDVIHMMHDVVLNGKSGDMQFPGIQEVGNRRTYKATVVFDAYSILYGNAAHLIPLAKAFQQMIATKFPNLEEETLVLHMDSEAIATLATKEHAKKERTETKTQADLSKAIDNAFVFCLT